MMPIAVTATRRTPGRTLVESRGTGKVRAHYPRGGGKGNAVGKRATMPYFAPMENAIEPAKPARVLRARVLWFLVGAVVNYLLIATPFKYLRTHTALPIWQISACSVGVGTVFFFLWNYFVNFRTDSRKRDALARYLTAVVVLYSASTGLLTLFKHINAHLALNLGRFPIDLDVVTTQLCMGWLKFIVYHKWAFPVAKR
jgi:putative flippase GtrA